MPVYLRRAPPSFRRHARLPWLSFPPSQTITGFGIAVPDLNLLPYPPTLETVQVSARSGAAIAARLEDVGHGYKVWAVTTTAATADGIDFGTDGVTPTSIPVLPGTEYTVRAWIKGVSGYAGVSFRLRGYDEDNANVLGGATITLTSSWQEVVIGFNTEVAQDRLIISLHKASVANIVSFEIAGLELLLGHLVANGEALGVGTVSLAATTNVARLVGQGILLGSKGLVSS